MFVGKLSADNNHLKTGFLGTPWLLPALSRIGRDDLAMKLLLNKDYPSWGFEISMGATTVWERWNSIQADGSFGDVNMNSFNHYAYGAVGDWMFQHIGGLQALSPGYKTVRIAPLIGASEVSAAQCTQRTPYGLLSSDWKLSGHALTLAVTIPANTSADIILPTVSKEAVLEGGMPLSETRGITVGQFTQGMLTIKVGSGNYQFTAVEQ
jgi:alpha-L-rhamnosidase